MTCSGWLTHISGHPSAAGQAQDRESSPARDRRSTTVPRHQPGIRLLRLNWHNRRRGTESRRLSTQLSTNRPVALSRTLDLSVDLTAAYGCRRVAVVRVVRRMNHVTLHRARLVPGWVTVCRQIYRIGSVCKQPARSIQPYIPPGSLNRVPASAGIRAKMSPLPGSR